MNPSLAIGFICLAAVVGLLCGIGWASPKKPLRDTFNEMHHAPENIEQRSRRIQ